MGFLFWFGLVLMGFIFVCLFVVWFAFPFQAIYWYSLISFWNHSETQMEAEVTLLA